MRSHSIKKLISIFSKFPGVGPRSAGRFVFHILNESNEEISELVKTIVEVKEKTKTCPSCFNKFEGEDNLCQICSNPMRKKETLCIVEKETDLDSIEKTNKYSGLYLILGGTLSAVKKEDISRLRVRELEERIKNSNFKEIIIALNPTAEGEATMLYLERLLKPLNIKTTRLGMGLPIGGELEYADEETLSSALEGRK
jgi:recombination protein RecR